MWFTRVSLQNPVFATMMMLALVALGLFSFQRLQVDQFPRIDFPVVVVVTDYPGASPEIVESEVSKKIEEGVNTIAGINALSSRSYEGQSVVVIEFDLATEGRKAAEDVREKVSAVRPLLRDEVGDPRVLRFDPASRAVWSVAVLPDTTAQGAALGAVDLSNWAEQTFKKRIENVRGVGLGHRHWRHTARDQHPPQCARAGVLGISPDQVVAAIRNENQDIPVGTLQNGAQERVRADSGAHETDRPTLARSSWPAKTVRPSAWNNSPRWLTAPRRSRTWRCTTASAACC